MVLDAGHGGSDSGAVNARYNLKEKEQTLDVARRLEVPLEADGHAVCMTRTGDKTLSNNDRYANTTGAEVMVSVHMNGSPDPDYTTTLFWKWRKDKELALATFDGLSTLPAANGTGTIDKRDPYSSAPGVLLRSDMPATIAETVFITNGRYKHRAAVDRSRQVRRAEGRLLERFHRRGARLRPRPYRRGSRRHVHQ